MKILLLKTSNTKHKHSKNKILIRNHNKLNKVNNYPNQETI